MDLSKLKKSKVSFAKGAALNKNSNLTKTKTKTAAEKAARDAANKKSGISFQTILIILVIVLIGITICVKIFLKPEEEEIAPEEDN